MKKRQTITIAAIAAALIGAPLLAGCTQADTVNQNLSQDAENFKVERKIIAINGITDKVIMEVTGRCSVDTADSALAGAFEITCKIAEDAYKKDFVYLSDNVTVADSISAQGTTRDAEKRFCRRQRRAALKSR